MKQLNPTIQYLGFIGLIPLLSCAGKEKNAAQANPAPNVIYVFPDQMRNSAMGFWSNEPYTRHFRYKGDPVITPNLNKFADEAVVFSSAFSNCPLSSPHRGSLMTGMYPNKSGAMLNMNSSRPVSSLRDDAVTISDLFSQNGYNCAYIGKYHLDYPTPNDPDRPGHYVEDKSPVWDAYTPPEKRHGFDFWYSYGTFDVHKHPHYWDTKGTRHEIHEWSPKHDADIAISYLQNNAGQRDSSKPFFMMVSMNPPHHPYRSLDDCMEEDYNLYKNKTPGELLIRDNADTTMAKAASAPYYFAQVTGVDREFGRILQALDSLGLSENTIVVFASDHGETMCSHGINDPKNSPYTEATNIPFLIRYPGKLSPKVENHIFASPDIMPTLLGLCGLSDKIPQQVQGYNFAEYLTTGKSSLALPESALYIRNMNGEKDMNGKVNTYFPESRGVKTSEYTLSLSIDRKSKRLKQVLFFHDEADPYQLHNLSLDDYPTQKISLLKELALLLKKAEDPWYNERILADMIPY
ncbi:MAG: sulfatase [Proteiniphilum sp.]|nr:sulfatase [Proteiniphilum sp.]